MIISRVKQSRVPCSRTMEQYKVKTFTLFRSTSDLEMCFVLWNDNKSVVWWISALLYCFTAVNPVIASFTIHAGFLRSSAHFAPKDSHVTQIVVPYWLSGLWLLIGSLRWRGLPANGIPGTMVRGQSVALARIPQKLARVQLRGPSCRLGSSPSEAKPGS